MDRRLGRGLAVTALALLACAVAGPGADASTGHAQIEGSGSSWAANAVNQWIADVQQSGLQVVFTSTGSAQGRKDFANKTTDFAVSDIGYQGDAENDTPQGRAFAYLPIAAGGTSFPYQVRVAGSLVRSIRLSGRTLAEIFTNHITNWNDPQITKDNNGHALPDLPIVPVVHSEGSGSTAQFTRYLAKEFPDLWQPFEKSSSFTEYWSRQGNQVAQNGSDGVMNFLSSSAGNGAIGYDEYSYALGKNYPVARIENSAGYYTAPTQYNVAVALTKAVINYNKSSPDYLLQNLDNVYADNDTRTYPLSSYSYGLIPTAANDPRMTTAKRQTLADFLSYSVCQGQAEIGVIGYSALPINLVQASFQQVAQLHKADTRVNLQNANVSSCHNPTFVAGQPNRNYLAEVAPKPPACAKAGAGPCMNNEDLINGNVVNGHPTAGRTGGTTPASGGSSGGGGGGGGSSGGGTTPTTTGHGPSAPGLPTGSTAYPVAGGNNGQPPTLAGSAESAAAVQAVSSLPAARPATVSLALVLLAVGLVLALLAVPPAVAHRHGRRKADG